MYPELLEKWKKREVLPELDECVSTLDAYSLNRNEEAFFTRIIKPRMVQQPFLYIYDCASTPSSSRHFPEGE